ISSAWLPQEGRSGRLVWRANCPWDIHRFLLWQDCAKWLFQSEMCLGRSTGAYIPVTEVGTRMYQLCTLAVLRVGGNSVKRSQRAGFQLAPLTKLFRTATRRLRLMAWREPPRTGRLLRLWSLVRHRRVRPSRREARGTAVKFQRQEGLNRPAERGQGPIEVRLVQRQSCQPMPTQPESDAPGNSPRCRVRRGHALRSRHGPLVRWRPVSPAQV